MKLLIVALYGLVALAAKPPATLGTRSKYNDGRIRYKCYGIKVLIGCVGPLDCPIIERCENWCISSGGGAGCAVNGHEIPLYLLSNPDHLDKRQVDQINPFVPATGINKDDTATKKTYECSNDHTGVLICHYGFCSTDHYCKKGTMCSDTCGCCRRGLQEIAGSDTTQILPRSTELAPRGGCTPGKYTCNLNPFTNSAWILTCNPKGEWQYSSDCGSNIKCIESPEGVAHCSNPGDQWNRMQARKEPTATVSLSPPDATLARIPDQSTCPAGHFSCAWNTVTRTDWVVVCNGAGDWQWSSDCSPSLMCKHDLDAVAHCVARSKDMPTLST
ncbi:hypothetical protein HRS9122_00567 [Pyrenophora teres f. teres]|nr:hypothetical protein HRS9122_00567 [Pyrenophora teres f. teres]